ncbi:MAG: SusC/RagA family TonB-linked outer membrane protein [Prevotella sp.]|nr:SusC/RagA family TonB-linked outer membrane protein [Prevotella sp.]
MILFLFFGISVCYANNIYSQTTRLTLNLKNKTIKEVFSEIEKGSEYVFLYHDENLEVKRKVTVSVKDQTIDKVLDDLFKDTDNIYFISDRQVFISKSKESLEQLKQRQEPLQQRIDQKIAITGKIMDADNSPLIGVTVKPKSGKPMGTITNPDGEFIIYVNSMDETLIFSYIGMKEKQVKLKQGTTNYKVVMEPNEAELATVVVEAGIIQRNRMGFTGSYKTMNKDELLSIGNMNVLQTVATLDPAFSIAENNLAGSNPNVLANISLRGGSTMNITNVLDDQSSNPNEPLFILDGFETTLQVVNDLDINRIQSITLLKDAGSTAIYGSKGGNGVVVIETIKPKAGAVMIDYSGDFRFSSADLSVYNLMNAAEKLEYEVKAGRYGDINDWYNPKLADYNSHLTKIARGVDTYWLKVPVQTALTQGHSLNVSGGNDNFLYQAGANFKDVRGVMKDSWRQSFGGNMRLTYRKDNISVSNNLSVSITNGHEGSWGSFSEFAKANPYYEMINPDGTIPENLDGYDYYGDGNYTYAANPYYNAMLASRDDSKNYALVNNTSFDWHILDNLRWSASMSLSNSSSDGVKFRDPKNTSFRDADYTQKGEYTSSAGRSWRYNVNTTLTYAHSFLEAHNLSFTGRAAAQSDQRSSESYIVTGFPPGVEGIPSYAYSYKEGTRPSYSENIDRQVSFLLAFNYNYLYRYLFDFNCNSDGTTAFGRNQKFQNFWSLGAGWNVQKEDFAKEWKWLQELKFRGTYGLNGNQSVDNVSANVYNYYSGNDIFGSASYLSRFANPDLKWQVVKKSSVGFDLVTLGGKLNLVFDLYRTKTDPMVVEVEQKPSSGVSKYPVNYGYVNNKGLEFSLGYYLIRDLSKQISLNLRLTGGAYTSVYGGFENALNQLNEAFKSEANPNQNRNSLVMYQDGTSPSALWAVRSLGIDPGTGKEIFLTKDGVPTTTFNINDRVNIADRNPKIKGVIGLNFKYKKLTANINLRYSLGGYNFNSALFNKVENILISNIIYNQDKRALYDRWQEPGDISQFKGISIGTTTPMSSRFIQRDNFLSGESARIAWDFTNKSWLGYLGLQDLRLSLSMSELFRISTIKQERGIDYPFERSVSMGVSARF